MLSHLHIENIAVIETMDIVFGNGLNLLTGETGAGKSIVIDALGAVLGARITRELVRTGAQQAHSGAVFRDLDPAALSWLEDTLGIQCADEELLVSRDILADGRTVCRVAGKTVTVSQLREFGVLLAQIHGQHDSQSLLDEDTHLSFVDAYGDCGNALDTYQSLYREWKGLCAERDALLRDDADKARRVDMLTYQLDEIATAELMPGEDKALTERKSFLNNARKVAEAIEQAYELIYGGEDSVHDQLSVSSRALSGIAGVSGELAALAGRVDELLYAADDAAEDIRRIRDELDADPNELNRIETRLDIIYRLKRKYGKTVDDILSFAENSRSELELIETSGERLAALEKSCNEKKREVDGAAEALSELRRAAADGMRSRLVTELRELDMERAEFSIELMPSELYQMGAETAKFLFSANVGEPPKPLSKIASGGELARVMLSIMNILGAGAPTMVFDEVDTGISGRAAQKVAQKLKSVSKNKQVLCVTHLPQIAAVADKHFHIEKYVEGGRTATRVNDLDKSRRIDEIARIIGGANITEVTRKTAAEMIEQGESK